MRQQVDEWTNLLTEMRLKWKEGTQRTSVKMSEDESLTVPMCVIGTRLPLGNSTVAWIIEVTLVKQEREWTMQSVALVSRIHEFFLMLECGVVCDEKAEWDKFGVKTGLEHIDAQKGIPVIEETRNVDEEAVLAVAWWWPLETFDTKFVKVLLLIKASNCSHWACTWESCRGEISFIEACALDPKVDKEV